MSKKVFLAAPFKGLINPENSLLESNAKRKIEQIIELLELNGCEVHNAHKREGWGQDFMTPEECTEIDYNEIKNCDLFIAIPGIPASPGTHIEIGWASAFGKKIIFLLKDSKEKYAYLVRGLHMVADVKYIIYDKEDDYLEELKILIGDGNIDA